MSKRQDGVKNGRIVGEPQFASWIEDPDPPDYSSYGDGYWQEEDYDELRRRLRAYRRGEDFGDSFNEEDHPRDDDGKFTSGGGSSESKSSKQVLGYSDKPLSDKYSSKAKLKDGVIHTSDVYDAVLAIHEDRAVELDQPDQLSTLVEKLATAAKEMVERGEEAPDYDLCKATVKGTNLFCADHQGIPRVKMPQMDREQTEAFVESLKAEGFATSTGTEASMKLRATQSQLDAVKINNNYQKLKKGEGKGRRLIISRDNYVLDGHHYWAAEIAKDSEDGKLGDHETQVFRIDIPIIPLWERSMKFTGGKGSKGLKDAFREEEHPRDEFGKWTNSGGSGPISEKSPKSVGKLGKIAPINIKGVKTETRYHVLKKEHWEQAKEKGYLDPKSYEMGEGVWTAQHPFQYYSNKFGGGHTKIGEDEIELTITLPKKSYKEPRGGGTYDRVTKHRIPLQNITAESEVLAFVQTPYAKQLASLHMTEENVDRERLVRIYEKEIGPVTGRVTTKKIVEAIYNSREEASAEGKRFSIEVTKIHGESQAGKSEQTKRIEFQSWFGSSQMTDKDGLPKVYYHATAKDFDEFKAGGDDPSLSGKAIWLTPNALYQQAYHNIGGSYGMPKEGTRVIPVFVRMERPLVIDNKQMLEWARTVFAGGSKEFPMLLPPKTIANIRQDDEYDGIIFKSAALTGSDLDSQHDEVIVFEPNQIKSAMANKGAFSRGDNRITELRTKKPKDVEKAFELPKGRVEMVERVANEVAAEFGIDPKTVKVDKSQTHLNTGQDKNVAAATANLGTLEINVYPHNVWPGLMQTPEQAVRGTMVHEIGHVRYQTMMNEYMAGVKAGRTGEVYEKMRPFHDGKYLDKLVKDDGITEYSKGFWERYGKEKTLPESEQVKLNIALHETIAEMMRVKDKTGKLKGSPEWQAYYVAVMESYEIIRHNKLAEAARSATKKRAT